MSRTYFKLNFAANVVPPELSATFDIRLANDIDFDEFEQTVS